MDLLTDKEKTYEAVLHLGIDTDTQDMSGTVLEEKPVNVTEEEVRKGTEKLCRGAASGSAYVFCFEGRWKETFYELAREGQNS